MCKLSIPKANILNIFTGYLSSLAAAGIMKITYTLATYSEPSSYKQPPRDRSRVSYNEGFLISKICTKKLGNVRPRSKKTSDCCLLARARYEPCLVDPQYPAFFDIEEPLLVAGCRNEIVVYHNRPDIDNKLVKKQFTCTRYGCKCLRLNLPHLNIRNSNLYMYYLVQT